MSLYLNEEDLTSIGHQLTVAEKQRQPIAPFTDAHADFSVTQAYQVQTRNIRRKLNKENRVSGFKMGLTSRAKMEQMGVSEPIFGVLTSTMQISADGVLERQSLIHPRVEPEIAFLFDCPPAELTSRSEILSRCCGVCAAIEVLDSRFRDFKFQLSDVIADNCSAAAYVLGSIVRAPAEVDLANLGMVLEIDGVVRETASSAAVLGNPVASVEALLALLKQGSGLKLGSGSVDAPSFSAGSLASSLASSFGRWVVLTGGATAAIALPPSARSVKVTVQDLGSVRLGVRSEGGGPDLS